MNYLTEEVVSKSNWAHGLFCVGCARRILNGHTAYWTATEAYCSRCVGKDKRK